jgi:8-amino-7-oxononanoate synthase
MSAEYVLQALADLDRSGLKRSLHAIERIEGPRIWIEGRPLLNFCSNDYLGLSQDPSLREVLRDSDETSFGAGSSRLLSGTLRAHRELEADMAEFKGLAASLLFGSAYMANLGLLTTLAGPETTVISDRLNHASLIDGIRLSKAKVRVFEHARSEAVEKELRGSSGRRLIITESFFGMDGDRAPIEEYRTLAERFEADLVIDDTHALGVFGREGRGLADGRFPIQVCNLSKAAGAIGGFVLGDQPLVDLLVSRARTFIYTTSLPAVICSVGRRALELVRTSDDRRARLKELCEAFVSLARSRGFDPTTEGPVFPIRVGDAGRAIAASRALWDRGFFLPAIRPPTVPEGAARLRVSLTALHEPGDVEALVTAMGEAL